MSIGKQIEAMGENLRASRKAIIGRGGEISETAGLKDLPMAIYNIPNEISLTYIEDDGVAYRRGAPIGAKSAALIKGVGGMTRRCENLIPYPYRAIDADVSGVKFVVGDDGSIKINGKATESVNIALWYPTKNAYGKGSYTISGGTSTITVVARKYTASGGNASWIESKGTAASGTLNAGESVAGVNIYIPSGNTVNATIYPMFNFGNVAMPYEPYFKGLRNAKVSAVISKGANLIPYPYELTSRVVSGVTITANSDGFVSFSGTCTGYGEVVIARNVGLGTTRCAVGTGVSHGTNGVICVSKQGNTLGNNASLAYEPYGNGTIVSYLVTDATYSGGFYPMINFGTEPADYVPYREGAIDTFEIPASIVAKDGYGLGVNAANNNRIEFDAESNAKNFRVNCRKFVINGNSGRYGSYGANTWYINPIWQNRVLAGVASGYKSLTGTENSNAEMGAYFVNTFDIFIRDYRFTDEATAKQILQSEPIEVVCAFQNELSNEDVTSEFIESNFIKVESGGEIVAENEYEIAAPLTIKYTKDTEV
jgi:hypothetical protein